ncbi:MULTISPECIES: MBL fold metallo-hydrolase [Streptomycetaceae]|uniref:Putative metal dependent hydrolase n=1 Tax=Streptantibioticus cattleyicolor (strain ATCC 35852 / DSM 46488 / JCM 4925 / NBRC 14057 / NRRL 8057) TaxID=1003195 RepID=F8JYP5_STREN|nr:MULTISPECIES: MBL fold metallo-hydrolase [Streptomycetaceae]AEW93792.1 putative metal dependent hydrolase [Streptantibioticus cattleyicolor NRRL 8057 = DSM 46488]MYS58478.1 MBL fold metallo-hydrolase [Streptomyces sp. SID5468]CCB74138.1 Beta lactamase [Streptantibioticus cattleyicolor NRRL 8057 = DSM 46488]
MPPPTNGSPGPVPPPPGVVDHHGGVWSLPVPIPDNPLGHTLVHVVATDRGPVLVDTGWDDPASWDALTEGLRACGTRVEDVYGVLVTHHHPDHHGLSARVRDASGAWIAMHPADIEVIRRSRATGPNRWLEYVIARLAAAGAPEAHLAPLRTALAAGTSRGPAAARAALPDRELTPGELADLPGRRLRVVWTPGHTPGHVCLHLEEGRRLFSGDHLLPGITPHIGLYEDDDGPEQDPLGDYLASLDTVAALDPAEVLPAHQYAFRDAPARVRAIRRHHAARLAGVRTLLTPAPLTCWQLAAAMEWNRPWEKIPSGSRTIAVFEAAAHLRRLVRSGLAAPVPGTDPVAYRAV